MANNPYLSPMKLYMTLKREWFDKILSGEKKEEYREFKEYWFNRLVGKNYLTIVFKNGYSKDARIMEVEYCGVELKTVYFPLSGKTEEVFAIQLGKILKNEKEL